MSLKNTGVVMTSKLAIITCKIKNLSRNLTGFSSKNELKWDKHISSVASSIAEIRLHLSSSIILVYKSKSFKSGYTAPTYVKKFLP